MAVFEITLTSCGEYHFRLLDTGNSKPILSGRQYTTKNACREGIDWVKSNAPYDYQYEAKQSHGKYYFILKAANGQLIGTSEIYANAADRDAGLRLVKTQATRAPVTDLT